MCSYVRLRADVFRSGDTVALLLAQRSIFPNAVHPPGSGTTALHLAASLPRLDVVNLLLEQDGIDDTLRDAQGRTCLEVAKGKEVQRAIKGAQDSFVFRTGRLIGPRDRFTESTQRLVSLVAANVHSLTA